MGLRVELFARIRRDARVEELSIRELTRRHGVARATVRQALAQAEPPALKLWLLPFGTIVREQVQCSFQTNFPFLIVQR